MPKKTILRLGRFEEDTLCIYIVESIKLCLDLMSELLENGDSYLYKLATRDLLNLCSIHYKLFNIHYHETITSADKNRLFAICPDYLAKFNT